MRKRKPWGGGSGDDGAADEREAKRSKTAMVEVTMGQVMKGNEEARDWHDRLLTKLRDFRAENHQNVMDLDKRMLNIQLMVEQALRQQKSSTILMQQLSQRFAHIAEQLEDQQQPQLVEAFAESSEPDPAADATPSSNPKKYQDQNRPPSGPKPASGTKTGRRTGIGCGDDGTTL